MASRKNAEDQPAEPEQPLPATDMAEVLSKSAENRLKWLSKVLPHISGGRVNSLVVYDIVAHRKFSVGASLSVGKQMRELILQNLNCFSTKQQRFLQSDANKLNSFLDDDGAPSARPEAASAPAPAEGAAAAAPAPSAAPAESAPAASTGLAEPPAPPPAPAPAPAPARRTPPIMQIALSAGWDLEQATRAAEEDARRTKEQRSKAAEPEAKEAPEGAWAAAAAAWMNAKKSIEEAAKASIEEAFTKQLAAAAAAPAVPGGKPILNELGEIIGHAPPDAAGSNDDLQPFLEDLGLSKYLPAFEGRGYKQVEDLRPLDKPGLKELGLLPGHVKLLLTTLASRPPPAAAPAPAAASAGPFGAPMQPLGAPAGPAATPAAEQKPSKAAPIAAQAVAAVASAAAAAAVASRGADAMQKAAREACREALAKEAQRKAQELAALNPPQPKPRTLPDPDLTASAPYDPFADASNAATQESVQAAARRLAESVEGAKGDHKINSRAKNRSPSRSASRKRLREQVRSRSRERRRADSSSTRSKSRKKRSRSRSRRRRRDSGSRSRSRKEKKEKKKKPSKGWDSEVVDKEAVKVAQLVKTTCEDPRIAQLMSQGAGSIGRAADELRDRLANAEARALIMGKPLKLPEGFEAVGAAMGRAGGPAPPPVSLVDDNAVARAVALRQASRPVGAPVPGGTVIIGSGAFGDAGQRFLEGDWLCPLCHAHNYKSKQRCFRCFVGQRTMIPAMTALQNLRAQQAAVVPGAPSL
eukprot:TRINITY_DN14123_c0_g1_i2.p1 TRINITY_DN14123_c0_g1~~TRINITY_DN14123_c0_g1_i2.p1  ORF type:complete len:756 (-),score=201.51 TRINITY_DN14123_c0_g1_i2:356-2623(-)